MSECHLNPSRTQCATDLQVGFGGWARMAQPLDKFAITEVRKPRVGENKPAAVTAEVTINTAGAQRRGGRAWGRWRVCPALGGMGPGVYKCAAKCVLLLPPLGCKVLPPACRSGPAGMRGDVRAEWEELKQHDVLFLLSIQPPDAATLYAQQQQGVWGGGECSSVPCFPGKPQAGALAGASSCCVLACVPPAPAPTCICTALAHTPADCPAPWVQGGRR